MMFSEMQEKPMHESGLLFTIKTLKYFTGYLLVVFGYLLVVCRVPFMYM